MVAEAPNGLDGEDVTTDAGLNNSDGQTKTPNEDSVSPREPDFKIESVNKISNHKKASNTILIKMA